MPAEYQGLTKKRERMRGTLRSVYIRLHQRQVRQSLFIQANPELYVSRIRYQLEAYSSGDSYLRLHEVLYRSIRYILKCIYVHILEDIFVKLFNKYQLGQLIINKIFIEGRTNIQDSDYYLYVAALHIVILLNKNDPTLVLTVRKYIGEMLFPCSRFPYNQRLLEETKKILDLANKISDDLYSNTQIEKKIEHNLLNEQQYETLLIFMTNILQKNVCFSSPTCQFCTSYFGFCYSINDCIKIIELVLKYLHHFGQNKKRIISCEYLGCTLHLLLLHYCHIHDIAFPLHRQKNYDRLDVESEDTIPLKSFETITYADESANNIGYDPPLLLILSIFLYMYFIDTETLQLLRQILNRQLHEYIKYSQPTIMRILYDQMMLSEEYTIELGLQCPQLTDYIDHILHADYI